MEPQILPNPFPGLRPYGPDEEHLFFGREKEVEAILLRLRKHRFLPVIGTSGCGKSSLVRSGLIPALESGLMVAAGSSWRIALCRPGEDPIGHLAAALDSPGVLGETGGELASTNRVLLDATLRRGSLGLVAAVRQAQLRPDDNVLIVVDQFEELFRFRRSRQVQNSRDEAVAFVKLLIEAARQTIAPIYVVLTMRSDFIGDCMEYPGLAEAINESHYLVPRMSRDALRTVITGPIAVAGGSIEPRLVVRLLNDLGDNQDELPLLQHVLMRMWDNWQRHGVPGEPIDVAEYVSVGTLRDALSQHAEEAFAEVGGDAGKRHTERVFKALTDTFTDSRGIRRPTSVAELAAICQIPETEVIRIVEIFRREGRSFLMPPSTVPLTSRTVVDISHESLMRGWTRLITWAQEERASANAYLRLSREASYFAEGAAALWGDPELELGLRWRDENEPTAAWAKRFDDRFDAAMDFLDRSERERRRQVAERRAQRVRRLRIAWGTASVLLVLFVIAAWQAIVARNERRRAEENFKLATTAVDELLASVDRTETPSDQDVPQLARFKGELLGKAQALSAEFIKQKPTNEILIAEEGRAHLRLGHINRMLNDAAKAIAEYRLSIARFEDLRQRSPSNPDYKSALANAYNWLAESLRTTRAGYAEAEQLYGKAIDLHGQLMHEQQHKDVHQQELARARYNRGILYAERVPDDQPAFGRAEADFREAIKLLEDVAPRLGERASQELGRVYNNLAGLLAEKEEGIAEARTRYEQAIAIHSGLVLGKPPASREAEPVFELVQFSNNYAELLRQRGDYVRARESSDRALALIEGLLQLPPATGVELADAHNLRARILENDSSPDAWPAYRESLNTYAELVRGGLAVRLPQFHVRFGDLLINLAPSSRARPVPEANRLYGQALELYGEVGRRAIESGDKESARAVLNNLTSLTEMLNETDRARVVTVQETLKKALAGASTP
jgi:tetratricopeptide (TPR) repeat protein